MSNNFTTSQPPVNNYHIQDKNEIDLGELIGTLLESKWLIISVTILALTLGIAKALISTPIYQADAMLQVEETSQPLGALGPIAELVESKVPIQTEIEIIKSRMILGEAVTNLGMEVIAKPKYFPIVGQSIARNFQQRNNKEISEPFFNYAEYAWGGEKIKIDTLNVPNDWIGKVLILIAGEKGRFQLVDNLQHVIAQGQVGKLVNKTVTNGATLNLFVSLLKARPGTHFSLSKHTKESSIQALAQNLSVVEKGKGTGILSFTMKSISPAKAMQRLNEIANIYVRINVENKSAEAQKTIEFLNKQLPLIKDQLDATTSTLNEYRLQKGSINLDLETQSILNGVVEKKTQITLLQQQRDELRRGFTPSHPTVIAIDKQIRRLQDQLNQHNKAIAALPETQQVIVRLARDVQVNNGLYTTLLNNLQTLTVAKAGTVGNVRVIDYAIMPTIPIKPKKSLIIIIAVILGLIIGIAITFIRKALHHRIEDPEIIEKQLNIPVYATVPHSDIQQHLNTQLKKNKVNTPTILAIHNKEDLAVESLRSLRTTLHFAFLEAKNKIIMITGPSPAIGKSFISTNLAIVLASSEKKILLIDADLRKGHINKILGVYREDGLSELISNTISLADAIRTIKIEEGNIDFIPTGTIPPNPSELLLHERFSILLETLGQKYDYIIIDSPPVLAVTDAVIIGQMASATLMVVKSGQHPLSELQQCVKRLKQNNIEIKGVVFNDVMRLSSSYHYGKYIYQYNYQK